MATLPNAGRPSDRTFWGVQRTRGCQNRQRTVRVGRALGNEFGGWRGEGLVPRCPAVTSVPSPLCRDGEHSIVSSPGGWTGCIPAIPPPQQRVRMDTCLVLALVTSGQKHLRPEGAAGRGRGLGTAGQGDLCWENGEGGRFVWGHAGPAGMSRLSSVPWCRARVPSMSAAERRERASQQDSLRAPGEGPGDGTRVRGADSLWQWGSPGVGVGDRRAYQTLFADLLCAW